MANTFVKLATASGGANLITFTSIPQGYKDLMIIGTAAMGFNAGYVNNEFTFNNTLDSSNLYRSVSNINISTNNRDYGGYQIPIEAIGTGGVTNNELSPVIMTIPNYSSTSTHKLINWRTGVVSQNQTFYRVTTGWGWYASTDAITSIKWKGSSGVSWNNYTNLTLYGIASS
jgi:hypothetical protein